MENIQNRQFLCSDCWQDKYGTIEDATLHKWIEIIDCEICGSHPVIWSAFEKE